MDLKTTPKQGTLFALSAIMLLTILVTWPLILNLGGFLLPAEYPDISHSDTLQHIGRIHDARELIAQGESPVIVDSTDVSQTYVFLGVMLLGIDMDDAVYHNLFFLISIVLFGLFTYLYIRELCDHWGASLIAGAMVTVSVYIPYAYYWGHSNTVQIQWIPLIFFLTERLLNTRRWTTGLLLGLALSLQLFASSYNAIHLSFILPAYLLLRIIFYDKKPLKDKQIWLGFGAALATTLVISGYYLFRRLGLDSIPRTLEENMMDYWRIPGLIEFVQAESHFFMGWIQLALASLGIYLIIKNWQDGSYRRYVGMALLSVFLVVAMMGPFAWWSPHHMLFRFWPLMDRLRVPFRMFPFFLIFSSALAAMPIVHLEKTRFRRYLPYLLAVIFIMLVAQIFLSPWLTGLHIVFL